MCASCTIRKRNSAGRSFRMNGHDLQASGKYEELKSSGSPEFNVFFRKVGATDMDVAIKGGWYPVGSLA